MNDKSTLIGYYVDVKRCKILGLILGALLGLILGALALHLVC